jgi:hypothetical protein
MIAMNKYDKFVKKALNEMFVRVGAEYDEEFVKEDGWYSKKTWTKDQREDFKNWFIKETKKELKFNKTMAEKEFAWFDLNWGWKES